MLDIVGLFLKIVKHVLSCQDPRLLFLSQVSFIPLRGRRQKLKSRQGDEKWDAEVGKTRTAKKPLGSDFVPGFWSSRSEYWPTKHPRRVRSLHNMKGWFRQFCNALNFLFDIFNDTILAISWLFPFTPTDSFPREENNKNSWQRDEKWDTEVGTKQSIAPLCKQRGNKLAF